MTSIRVDGGRQGANTRPGGQSGRGMQFGQGQGSQSQGTRRLGRSGMMPEKGAPDGTSSASLNQGTGDIQNPSGGKQ